jgi:hypothetical protein
MPDDIFAPIDKQKLSKKQHETLEDYILVDYYELNEYQRNKSRNVKRLNRKIEIIDSIFDQQPKSKAPVVVYRGQPCSTNIQPNTIFSINSFLSTSFSKTHAKKFVEKDNCLLEITIPRGFKGLNMKNYTHEEQELLLPATSVFKVERVDGKEVHLKLISQEGAVVLTL